jgi:predicted RecB family nuclease
MQCLDGRTVLSASDLNDFLACEHLTGLDLRVLAGELERPSEKSSQGEILARLGDEHERRYLQWLRESGTQVVTIDRSTLPGADRLGRISEQADATIQAMRAGAAAIYQATFFDGTWLGHADVLRRVEEPSALGEWSYEVEDAKLARSTKPYFLVQLCFYSACVERIQGRRPDLMHVVLGDGTRHSFRVAEFAAYERYAKRRLEERALAGPNGAAATYPNPVSHCSLCVWDKRCSEQRRRDDSLTEVAGLSRLAERRLRSAGIATLAQLGRAGAAARPANMEPATFEKLARQARLQLDQRIALAAGEDHPYRYELLAVDRDGDARRGFALLPKPSDGDVFFDMEGDPFYDVADGLEYLFGAYTHDEGFRAFWGCDRGTPEWHDRLAEKRAFEAFVDFVMARRARWPDLHVYHYADYEKRALKSLAQRHATREDEVDTLLREERLVDLLRVVRQSVVVGQPGYGLKRIEAFFGGRQTAIASGDESVVEFERWRLVRDAAPTGTARDVILMAIEAYNEQDCVSTSKLRDWLLERRLEAQQTFGVEIPFFCGKQDAEETPGAKPDRFADLKARLGARIPETFDPAAASAPDASWRYWAARQLLDYHRREEKPVWWAFFDRCETYADEPARLLEDGDCIVYLELVGPPVAVKRSLEYAFRFPPQELKTDGGTPFDPATKERAGTRVTIELANDEGRLRLVRGPSASSLPLPSAIIVHDVFPSAPLRASLARFGEALLEGAPGDGRYRATYDLLTASVPRLQDRAEGARLQPDTVDSRALSALIDQLDDSYLFVQGPPGSGKTYQGAHAIVTLLGSGKRVGVTANSHKAINNLLHEVERVAHERRVPFEGQRKASDDDDAFVSRLGGTSTILNVKNGGFTLGDGGLYAGTVWAFADPDLDGRLDVLFVDEAGQVALPNALAATTAAHSVVLLGDPLQLSHVRHSSHPGNIGLSVLEHLLGGDLRPVAPDRGVLLDHTWRMHPDVCRFISDLMYEGRLRSVEGCSAQRIDSAGLSGTGIRYLAVDHADARVRSLEEAQAIAEQIELLLQGTVTDAYGWARPLEPHDLIVVTPYNSQRRCIEAELRARGHGCERVPVGTVDKFQGQEAYVVFFSSANSSPDDAPRGVEFIFERNRLNVAISRARALAVYAGSPLLLRAVASTIGRMRALAAGCALVEYGTPV